MICVCKVRMRTFALLSHMIVNCAGLLLSDTQADNNSISEFHQALPRSSTYSFRLLCIGDSITAGYKSSDGNGYRLDLRNLLQDLGKLAEQISKIKHGGKAVR